LPFYAQLTMADDAAAVDMDTSDGPSGALNGAAANTVHDAATAAPDGEGDAAATPNAGATAPTIGALYTAMDTADGRRARRRFPPAEDPRPPCPEPPVRDVAEPWIALHQRSQA
jgi:hypothetical protein